ncbi:MAG: hypothetical protein ACOWWO_20020 [Peptococcaceae bacterium]
MNDIKLTKKQMEYIMAKVKYNEVFLKYREHINKYEHVWQYNILGFIKIAENAREITGLDQAAERLEGLGKELTAGDNIELLNNIADFL